MTALLKFKNGKKIFESINIDGGDLFKEMMKLKGDILLVSQEGQRITKGNIPLKINGSFSWIV